MYIFFLREVTLTHQCQSLTKSACFVHLFFSATHPGIRVHRALLPIDTDVVLHNALG